MDSGRVPFRALRGAAFLNKNPLCGVSSCQWEIEGTRACMLWADGRNRGCYIRAGERGCDCPGRIPEAALIHSWQCAQCFSWVWLEGDAEGGFNAALFIHQMSMGWNMACIICPLFGHSDVHSYLLSLIVRYFTPEKCKQRTKKIIIIKCGPHLVWFSTHSQWALIEWMKEGMNDAFI